MLEIVFVAFSLALDAAAVSVAVSAACPQGGVKQALRLGLWFGSFQFFMPLLGFHLGQTLTAHLSALAPWLAFALLTYIGGKLLWDAFSPARPGHPFHPVPSPPPASSSSPSPPAWTPLPPASPWR